MQLPSAEKYSQLSQTEQMELLDRVNFLTAQIQYSSYVSAIALREIRDQKLYQVLGFEEFDEFVQDRIAFLKLSQVNNFLLILDRFPKSEKIQEMFGKNSSFQALLAVAKEIESSPETTEITDEKIAELVEQKVSAIKKKNKELKELVQRKDSMLEAKDEEIGKVNDKLRQNEADKDRIITAMATDKGIDKDKFLVLNSERDFKNEIMTLFENINRAHEIIINYPKERRSAEVTNIVNMMLATLTGSTKAIENNWITELADYTPINSSKNQDFSLEVDEDDVKESELEEELVP